MDSPPTRKSSLSHPSPASTNVRSGSSETPGSPSRDTTPDSNHHISGSRLSAAINSSYFVPDLAYPSIMDRSPFEPANSRRNYFPCDRAGHAQNNDLRDHILTPPSRHMASRSLTSANWRDLGSGMDRPAFAAPSTPGPFHNPLASASPTRYSGYGGPHGLDGAGTDEFSMLSRGVGHIQLGDNEADDMYGYCFDRGNGQYTRLIPADMLPPLMDIPALQQGCAGMKVLPVPRGLAPNGRSSNSERVGLQLRAGLNGNDSDFLQSQIDNIIAASPPPASQKRVKIFCDKWVHEGVCAFTQQGCKYKHEMPFDKATQHSLGLFHGLPAWWKKHQAELSRQRQQVDSSDQPVAVSSRDRGLVRPNQPNQSNTTPWRRSTHALAPTAQFSSPFGPICPPSRKPGCASSPDRLGPGIANLNPFYALGQIEENGEGESVDGARLG